MDADIRKTQQWLDEVIIGLNFCPFAKKEFVNNTIHYQLCSETKMDAALKELAEQCQYLIAHPEIETTLLIFNPGFGQFERYLDLVDYANQLLLALGYEGIIQLASFHPDYIFQGEDEADASHYTNRSPLPTLHLIREASIEKVLSTYKKPEKIPENNIALAQKKGSQFFQALLARIHQAHE